MKTHMKVSTITVAVGAALALIGCGGSGGGSSEVSKIDQSFPQSATDIVKPGVDSKKVLIAEVELDTGKAAAQCGLKIVKYVEEGKQESGKDYRKFRDLNSNGKVDVYENWSCSVEERTADLLAQMTLEEKAGMMLIETLNAGCQGSQHATVDTFINKQKMTRFILRSTAAAKATDTCKVGDVPPMRGAPKVTPEQLATFSNEVQKKAANARLGIPAIFKDNARNHVEADPRFGIAGGAGAFSQFPKEAGLAAAALGEEFLKTGKTTTGDMSIIKTFTEVMGQEYNAVGFRAGYVFMADLLTEPRWYRAHEVFTEDADLNANIMDSLVKGLQGGPINKGTRVALTVKHFPGGGPQELGMDPHYAFGKFQYYPSGNFGYHMKPFKAAIDAGVSSIMPYYGVPMSGRDSAKQPIALTYEGVTYPLLGFAFSKAIVTDLLRGKLGFKGYVNSDTGIINDRAWGMEGNTIAERAAAAINGGTDVLSGFSDNSVITKLKEQGLLTEARINEAVKALLKEQFSLGLFENPYVDASKAASVIGKAESVAKGLEVQKKSVVLLDNKAKVLPLKDKAKVYTIGMGKADVESYGYTVTDGNYADGKPETRPSAAGNDVAVIRVLVKDKTAAYNSLDPKTGANPAYLNPLTGKVWGAEDPCVTHPGVNAVDIKDNSGNIIAHRQSCVDVEGYGNALVFGGALPWEIGDLTFSGMAKATSRTMYPSLEEIQKIAKEVGGWDKVVLSIYFRAPFVLDDASNLKQAGAIMATFGVTDKAMMEVVSGKFTPMGKLPFALPKTQLAVEQQNSDAPGYDETTDGALYKFGYGMNKF